MENHDLSHFLDHLLTINRGLDMAADGILDRVAICSTPILFSAAYLEVVIVGRLRLGSNVAGVQIQDRLFRKTDKK
jgi:hypothetical protein